MIEKKFLKHKIVIERVDQVPGVRREWKVVNAAGDYGYTPELEVAEYQTTEVLKMESREEIDLKKVIAAILGM